MGCGLWLGVFFWYDCMWGLLVRLIACMRALASHLLWLSTNAFQVFNCTFFASFSCEWFLYIMEYARVLGFDFYHVTIFIFLENERWLLNYMFNNALFCLINIDKPQLLTIVVRESWTLNLSFNSEMSYHSPIMEVVKQFNLFTRYNNHASYSTCN